MTGAELIRYLQEAGRVVKVHVTDPEVRQRIKAAWLAIDCLELAQGDQDEARQMATAIAAAARQLDDGPTG